MDMTASYVAAPSLVADADDDGATGGADAAALAKVRNPRKMSSPTLPLFSGWNCVAKTFPF